MTRVLLVDDSPSVRAVLRRFLRRTDDLQVAGEAEDGQQAVQAVFDLQPDVILMDLQMPVMDGYTAIEKIMAVQPTPIVVLTSRANRNQMQTAFEAMRRGALEVLPKPEDTESWNLLADSLPQVVRAVADLPRKAPPPEPRRRRPASPPPEPRPTRERHPVPRWIGVGASTGGPAAIREFLAELPVPCPATVLIVQHISPGFELGLADWLNRELSLDVRVARRGERLAPGQVRFAPAGFHLKVSPRGTVELDGKSPPCHSHRPAADELFRSLALHHPGSSAGVVLTGMGSDGAEGLAELRRRGGWTLVQDEASAVIYGMPRVALEQGAADEALPPDRLAHRLFESQESEP